MFRKRVVSIFSEPRHGVQTSEGIIIVTLHDQFHQHDFSSGKRFIYRKSIFLTKYYEILEN